MEHPTRVGKYQVEQFLGGGMSHVYRAKDTVLGRRVALKILTEAGSADAEAKARFLMEARMASNINHENIISVYDFGEDHGRPFIVMEFLEGESLRDAIKQNHLGDLSRRLRAALQLARALDYIHSRKIIHRDIKPENIHIDDVGKVTLMDFGIAKSEGVALTRAGFTLGTPYYMAPEQVLGRPLTPQADVYAFGILLFEMMTGAKPIMGDSVEKIFHQILYEPLNLEPLKALNTPALLCDLIARCTAKQLNQRPANLGEVCAHIEYILDPSRPRPSRAQASAQRIPAQSNPIQNSPALSNPTQTNPTPAAPQPQVPDLASDTPSVTHSIETPEPLPAGLPRFLEHMPAPLRTQGGLMFLAGLAMVLVLAVVYVILSAAHIV